MSQIIYVNDETTQALTAASASPPGGQFSVKDAGVAYVALGHYSSTAYGAYWGGSAAPSLTNFAFLGNGTDTSYFNVPSGGTIELSFGGVAATGLELTAAILKSTIPTWQFISNVTPKVTQADNTTNSVTGAKMSVIAQSATGTTSTGGDLEVGPGTGTSANGKLRLLNVATTTSAPGAGGAGALPATPAGYVSVTINGTARQLPYY